MVGARLCWSAFVWTRLPVSEQVGVWRQWNRRGSRLGSRRGWTTRFTTVFTRRVGRTSVVNLVVNPVESCGVQSQNVVTSFVSYPAGARCDGRTTFCTLLVMRGRLSRPNSADVDDEKKERSLLGRTLRYFIKKESHPCYHIQFWGQSRPTHKRSNEARWIADWSGVPNATNCRRGSNITPRVDAGFT